ncbi:YtxH domain-containing protein [Candidatus Saccharibacteria bacterium]|nr:YtxH domain-containing protein [Candidatus Saccharibacteria bacterium]
MAKDEQAGKKMAIGAAIAGVAGYLAGILTAPKSGKQTRTDIANKAEDIKEGAAEQLEQLHQELNSLLDKAKTQTIALSAQAREEFNEAVIRAKDAQNKTTHVLKAVKKGEADDPQLNKAVKQAKQAQKNLSKYLKS